MKKTVFLAACACSLATGCSTEATPTVPHRTPAEQAPASSSGARASVPVEADASVVAGPTSSGFAGPADHVPSDTFAYVSCSSLAELERAALRISAMAQLAGAPEVPVASLREPLARFGLEPQQLVDEAPLAIALRHVPGRLEPAVELFLPIDDTEAVARILEDDPEVVARTFDDGYMALREPDAPRGYGPAPDFVRAPTEGLVSVRVDVPKVLDAYGTLVGIALSNLSRTAQDEGRSEQEIARIELLVGYLTDVLESAEQLDLVARLDGDDARFELELTTEGGLLGEIASPVQPRVAQLVRHVRADDVLAAVVGFDATMESHLGPTRMGELALESLPGDAGETAAALEELLAEVLPAFEPGAAVAFDLTPGRMHVAAYLATENAATARDALGRALGSLDVDALGFDLSLPRTSRDGALVVEGYTVRFDPRRLDFDERAAMRETLRTLVGDSHLRVRVGWYGDEAVVVVGGDTPPVEARLRSLVEGDDPPADLVRATEALEGTNPSVAYRVEVLRLASLPAELMAGQLGQSVAETRRRMFGVSDPGAVPLTVWTGAHRGGLRAGASMDLADVQRLLELAERRNR